MSEHLDATYTYADLVAAYLRGHEPAAAGRLQRFSGIGRKSAYNPAVIEQGDDVILAVRLESPTSYWLDPTTWDPEISFFSSPATNIWEPIADAPTFNLAEDPFASWITGADGKRRLIFGCVKLDRSISPPEVVTYFYVADSVQSLDPDRPFAAVRRMKDIRLLQLPDGRIVAVGRPVGGEGGPGRCSLTILDDYRELTHERIWQSPVLPVPLDGKTKLGPNQLYPTDDPNLIGVLGHLAVGTEGVELRYAAATWTIDLAAGTCSLPQVVAVRDDFEPFPGKYGWTEDVIFPGSLYRDGKRTLLFAGLGDSACGVLKIEDPFKS